MQGLPLIPQSLSLRYSERVDRMQLIFRDSDGRRIDAWLTRRLLARLLEKVTGFVGSLATAGSVAELGANGVEQEKIAHFEYEMAQHQVPVTQEKMPETAAPDQEFLIDKLHLAPRGRDVVLGLADGQGQTLVQSGLSRPELHRIIGQLKTLADKADWRLPDPWGEQRGIAVPAACSASIH